MVNEGIKITDIKYCENYKKIFFKYIVYDSIYEYYIEEFSHGKFGKIYSKNSTYEIYYDDLTFFNDAYYKYKKSLRIKKLKKIKKLINEKRN